MGRFSDFFASFVRHINEPVGNITQRTHAIRNRFNITSIAKLRTLEDLSRCNKSIAISDDDGLKSIILLMKPQLGQLRSKLYLGKDSVYGHPTFWLMSPTDWDRQHLIYNGFNRLVHSGLFQFIQINYTVNSEIGRLQAMEERENRVRPINIKHNLAASTFILTTIGFGTSILGFIIEVYLLPLFKV
jgi:hypothetical protein